MLGKKLLVLVLVGSLAYGLTHPTIKVERIATTTSTLVSTPLSAAPNPNPGLPIGVSYKALQTYIHSILVNWWRNNDSGPVPFTSELTCLLPEVWEQGGSFQCNTYAPDSAQNGTATVQIYATNPGQKFTISVSWQST